METKGPHPGPGAIPANCQPIPPYSNSVKQGMRGDPGGVEVGGQELRSAHHDIHSNARGVQRGRSQNVNRSHMSQNECR